MGAGGAHHRLLSSTTPTNASTFLPSCLHSCLPPSLSLFLSSSLPLFLSSSLHLFISSSLPAFLPSYYLPPPFSPPQPTLPLDQPVTHGPTKLAHQQSSHRRGGHLLVPLLHRAWWLPRHAERAVSWFGDLLSNNYKLVLSSSFNLLK